MLDPTVSIHIWTRDGSVWGPFSIFCSDGGGGRGEGKVRSRFRHPSSASHGRRPHSATGVSLMAGRSHEFFRQHCASRSWLCLTLRYRVSRCPALPPDLQAEPAANWLRGRHFPDQICYQLLKVDIISAISSFSKRSVFIFFTLRLKTASWMKCFSMTVF